MKTTIIAMAALLISSVAYASGNVRVSMKPAESESATVEIVNEARNEVEIDVLNDYGDVIFSKKVDEPVANYQRKYDFTGLEDGNYMLRVNSGKELNETRFEILRGEITITGERKEVEPHIKSEGNIWKLSYLNFPMEDMSIYVYDGYRLLYEEKIEPVFAVHKGLDLSALLPGSYDIIFSNEYSAYEYKMEVK